MWRTTSRPWPAGRALVSLVKTVSVGAPGGVEVGDGGDVAAGGQLQVTGVDGHGVGAGGFDLDPGERLAGVGRTGPACHRR